MADLNNSTVQESILTAVRNGVRVDVARKQAGVTNWQFYEWRRRTFRGLGGKYEAFFSALHEALGRVKAHSRSARKYTLDEHYFEAIDTEEKAYWLGFIATDGWITKTGLGIGLNVKDRSHLELFSRCVKSDKPCACKPHFVPEER
jgi:hypothetical protein